jgi:3-polyprenyl-4-hydroxybenzoate decarboxylase
MEDGYLGEAVGAQLTPVVRFQHRDLRSLYLPLETGFHNLAIVSAKQRYPRQGRKTALGLLGAGQMMLMKTVMVIDEDEDPHDLEVFLDALNNRVNPSEDIIVIEGLPGDSLDPVNPFENVQSKILVDATSIPANDPRNGEKSPLGSPVMRSPEWRVAGTGAPGVPDDFDQLVVKEGIAVQARLLRSSMLVVTVEIEGGPGPREGMENPHEELALLQREKVRKVAETIWGMQGAQNLRWLFITDNDLDLHNSGAKRRLLWQLFARFDVDRGLHWDKDRERVAWDATAPIPSAEAPIPARRWPAVTLHDPKILERVSKHAEEDGLHEWEWPSNILM